MADDRDRSLHTPEVNQLQLPPDPQIICDSISFSERDLMFDTIPNSPPPACQAPACQYPQCNSSSSRALRTDTPHLQHPIPPTLPPCQHVSNGAMATACATTIWQPRHRPVSIHIEGNIGAGKTRTMYYLSHGSLAQYIDFLAEPVDKWTNFHGINLLNNMYTNPAEETIPFQTVAQLTLLENHLLLCDKPIKIMERSIHSCMKFAKLQCDLNIISTQQYNVLKLAYDTYCKSLDVKPDVIIFIDSTPEQCLHNIRSRGRPEEIDRIDINYLKSIHEVHTKWMDEVSQTGQKYLIASIFDLERVEEYVANIIKQLQTHNHI